MNTTDRVVKVLQDAARLLEQDGWCQNAYHRNRRHCAAGAICLVSAGDEDELWRDARLAFEKHVGQDLLVWNDTPGRTADEVVRELRAAAAERGVDS